MACPRGEAIYLSLVEALQRRLLPCGLTVSRMGLQECCIDKVEGPGQARTRLTYLIVSEGDKGKGSGNEDNCARCENIMVSIDAIDHPH